jgi:acyl-CoA thioester hydrolase
VIHETLVRVRYGEVDRMGVVYHANYLAYFETGRTEFLRHLGRSYRAVEEGGMLLVVADAGLRFHRPAGYDDELRVRTRLVELSGVRLRFEYEVDRPADATLVATGHTTLASTDPSGRPMRLPAALRTLLEGVVAARAGAPSGKDSSLRSVR